MRSNSSEEVRFGGKGGESEEWENANLKQSYE